LREETVAGLDLRGREAVEGPHALVGAGGGGDDGEHGESDGGASHGAHHTAGAVPVFIGRCDASASAASPQARPSSWTHAARLRPRAAACVARAATGHAGWRATRSVPQ